MTTDTLAARLKAAAVDLSSFALRMHTDPELQRYRALLLEAAQTAERLERLELAMKEVRNSASLMRTDVDQGIRDTTETVKSADEIIAAIDAALAQREPKEIGNA